MPNLLTKRTVFKPLQYPWAYEAYKTHEKMHWLPEEVALNKDVQDWNMKLTGSEKNLVTQIFRFFTQGDISVAEGYLHKYIPVFGHIPEIAMMLTSFAAREAIHIDGYSLLLETIGMPETEYEAFLKYKEMRDKHEFVQNIEPFNDTNFVREISEDEGMYYVDYATEASRQSIAKTLAVYSAFTEGMQLFSSFAILMSFPRRGLLKGMGQIVTWSVRDEDSHAQSMIKLFRTFIQENHYIWTDEFKKELYDIARTMVDMEDAFIDLAFEQGAIEGLTPEEVKQYIRFIADRRLLQLGLKANYGVKDNPLPWMEEMLYGREHANFFENSATEYSKASTTGSWDEVEFS